MGMAEMMKRMGLIDGFKIEYLEIADPDTLEKRDIAIFTGDRALAAIRLGTTRLIDNIAL
jgi:pantothenate synthetase